MNSLLKNRSARAHLKLIFTALGIFLLVWVIFSFFGGFIVSAVSPIWEAENAFSRTVKKTWNHLESRQNLVNENFDLKGRVGSLELEVASLTISLEQERAFYGLLGRAPVSGEVVASVIARPPQSPYDVILLDAGSREGITKDARVYLAEGPALGIITEVFTSSAKVKLFSTAGEKLDAVLERGSVPVVLEGRGAGNFRLKIPREVEVVAGDRIVTGDTEFSLLAVVEVVNVNSTDAFQEVLARSPLNIFSLRLVSVIPQ